MQEPWNTILFIVVIPVIQQLLKFVADKYGYTLNKLANQALSLVLSGIFLFISGGFAGLELPAWSGDLVAFVGDAIVLIGAGWATLMALYELVWDRLFTSLKFATQDKF